MKFCPYCGKPVREEDNYCESCGGKLEKNETQENAVEVQPIKSAPKKSGAPEWLLKMLSLISILCGAIFFLCQGTLAIGAGIACLIMDKEHKYRARCIAGIVLGSVFTVALIVFYIIFYSSYGI